MAFDNLGNVPGVYGQLVEKSQEIGFTMPSDSLIGALLKTLITSKPNGNFLELGTGIGLSLSWMVAGMDLTSVITTVDNDAMLTGIAESYFGADSRVTCVCEDGATWSQNYKGPKFDLIFADAWPGKYGQLEIALSLLKKGGYYVIDDMLEQPNWPAGHHLEVSRLLRSLEDHKDLVVTKMNWSTGILIAVKIN